MYLVMNKMKAKNLLCYFFIALSALTTSCTYKNIRTNYLVPGHFKGINSYNEERTYYLDVNLISYEEYIKADGKNVIVDLVRPNYFSLKLYYFYEEQEKVIDLYNFSDAFNGTKDIEIYYKDANGVWLCPFNPDNNKGHFYTIDLILNRAYIYFYLDIDKYS